MHDIPNIFLIFLIFLSYAVCLQAFQIVASLQKFFNMLIEKSLPVSGPAQFKLVLLRGQL